MSTQHSFQDATISTASGAHTTTPWHANEAQHPPIPEGIIPTTPQHLGPLAKQNKAASGLTHTWRLWRHCCCRYGWYPLLIAPILTIASFLSVYSTLSCDFVRVDVGFSPSNSGWNQSTAQLGMFLYQSGLDETNKYRDVLVDGCRWYEDGFTGEFVDHDRTWYVARLMAYIAGSAGSLAMITSWLFVVSPLPASFFWPGLLLPCVMAAFLAEGSKFLLFDVALCRNTLWYPPGSDSLPQVVEECTLGTTSYYVIAAASIYFVCLLLVCLKAPTLRILDSDFGTRTDLDLGDSDLEYVQTIGHNATDYEDRDGYSEGQTLDLSIPMGSMLDDKSTVGSRQLSRDGMNDPIEYGDSPSGRCSNDFPRDPVAALRLRTLDSHNLYMPRPGSDDNSYDDRYNPRKPKSDTDEASISESRLHTAERLELNTNTDASELIERFMSEVNASFVDTPKEDTCAEISNDEVEVSANLEACGNMEDEETVILEA
eukprot:Nitzschia sp. Nitz4//scaffold199_size41809//15716//17240//NITZ4_007450-RA/size41809-augustus-gene-0.40-mRNA-1//1//CDS//3329540561//1252//frame0